MPKKLDLKGQTFNLLTVIEELPHQPGEKIKWKCICACGNETVAVGSELKNGHKKSCGCLKGRAKNIENQTFGKLTALKPTSERDCNGNVFWECKCDCGKIVSVAASKLISGNTQSCGCQRIEKLIAQNKTRKK